ncbi:MAG: pantetheine-phosphate adenylyltransferase [Myxococcota bacterium]|jgi:pantetheine-phosphate adenylyltransferase|nr:pantetheine-phosphate adenylyltransferase [Myxococcota bacterium]
MSDFHPRIAAYAGSFDPPTCGHLDLIHRASTLVDTLIVAVGNNPRKHYLFNVDERMDLLQRSLHDLPNVELRSFSGLLVDFCVQSGASIIVRGLRAVGDFEFEFQMGLANMNLEPKIETIFLVAAPVHLFVSSSVVKEIAAGGRDVSRYVPEHVALALRERLEAS